MAKEHLNDDGQPARAFGWERLRDSRTDELIGLCRGVLADERLVQSEAQYVLEWLVRNPPVLQTSSGKRLFKSLDECLRDDVLTDEEEDCLVELLLRFTGGEPDDLEVASGATALPLCNPAPRVSVPGKAFCFTGKFTFGARHECEAAVTGLAGQIHKAPTLKTHYLVIGELGSRDWAHSNSGRKIEKAVEYRDVGRGICLISEAHWSRSLSCE